MTCERFCYAGSGLGSHSILNVCQPRTVQQTQPACVLLFNAQPWRGRHMKSVGLFDTPRFFVIATLRHVFSEAQASISRRIQEDSVFFRARNVGDGVSRQHAAPVLTQNHFVVRYMNTTDRISRHNSASMIRMQGSWVGRVLNKVPRIGGGLAQSSVSGWANQAFSPRQPRPRLRPAKCSSRSQVALANTWKA